MSNTTIPSAEQLESTLTILASPRSTTAYFETGRAPGVPHRAAFSQCLYEISQQTQCYTKTKNNGVTSFVASTPYSANAFRCTAAHKNSDKYGIYVRLRILTDAFGKNLLVPIEVTGPSYLYENQYSTSVRKKSTRQRKQDMSSACIMDATYALYCIFTLIVCTVRMNLFFNMEYDCKAIDKQLLTTLVMCLPAYRKKIPECQQLELVDIVERARTPVKLLLQSCRPSAFKALPGFLGSVGEVEHHVRAFISQNRSGKRKQHHESGTEINGTNQKRRRKKVKNNCPNSKLNRGL